MPDFATTAMAELTRSLASPEETIILATLDGRGGLVTIIRGEEPLELVHAARSLLSQATDMLDTEDADEAHEELLTQVNSALAELPDLDDDEVG